MKNFLILFIFVSLLFTGCDRHNGQQMSFLDTQTKVNTNIQNIGKAFFGMGFSGIKEKKYVFDVFSENSDFKLAAKINEVGVYNYENYTSQTENQINIKFFDKLEDNYDSISGKIYNIGLERSLYTKLGDFYINMGTGNYQNKLISMIISKINNKWIRMDNPFIKIQNIQKDLKYLYSQILTGISKEDSGGVFFNIEKTSYNGDLAYKVGLTSGFIQTINTGTDIEILNFKGDLIVHSVSNVELKIEKLELTGMYNMIINGEISSKKGHIKLRNLNNIDESINIDWVQNKKNTSLLIKKLKNLTSLWSLNISLSTKDLGKRNIENKTIWINGLLSVSPLLIYGSDLEKNIQIDINGQYEFSDIKNLNILKPDSYILIDQILGDQFSLQTLQTAN